MEEIELQKENWSVVRSLFPRYWENMAYTSAAVERLKRFSSLDALMQTMLMHIAHGYSLRETCLRAKESGVADISDVALMKRLQGSDEWFRKMCCALLKEAEIDIPASTNAIKMRLVDGTIVKEPGKSGSQWRIHYSLTLPSLSCDYFQLTPTKGGTNLSLKSHLRSMLNVGWSANQIIELLTFLIGPLGFPVAIDALLLFEEILGEHENKKIIK